MIVLGRALEAAAEALPPGQRDKDECVTRDVIGRYFDALLSELPPESVEAFTEVFYADEPQDTIRPLNEALAAFLLSLRSSSRGGPDDV